MVKIQLDIFGYSSVSELQSFPTLATRLREFCPRVYCDRKVIILGSLSKPRRRRQPERHQTKGLMSRSIAVHVRYNSLYISLPSSAKQQREMTKFCIVYGTWTTTANFSYFHLEFNAVVTYLAWAHFKSHWRTKQI